MDISKTAKEFMDEGKWEYLGSYSYSREKLLFYAESVGSGEDLRYRVHRMIGSSTKGLPLFWILKYGCKVLRLLFNLAGNKLGNEIFEDIIEECDEYLLARKHQLSVGKSFSLYGNSKNIEECKEAMEEEINRLMKRVKGRKGNGDD